MKAKYLFYSLAMAAAFTACSQEELVNNPIADSNDLAKRAVVGNVIFEGDEIESRYNVENATFQKGDKMGLYLMDTYNDPAGEAYPSYQSHWWQMYEMSNHISTNFSYVFEGNSTWVNPSAQLSEGNYIAMFPQNEEIKNRQSLWHPINANVQLKKHSSKDRYYVNRENQFFVAYEQISRDQEKEGNDLKAKISMKPILTYGKLWFVNGSNEEIKLKKVVFRLKDNSALPNIAYIEPSGIVKNEAQAKDVLGMGNNAYATTQLRIDGKLPSKALKAPVWAWNDLASMEQYKGYTGADCNTVVQAQGVYNRSMFTQTDARNMVRYDKKGNVYEYVFNFPGNGVFLDNEGAAAGKRCGISIALPAFENWNGEADNDWNSMEVLVYAEKKNSVTDNWEYGYISERSHVDGSINALFNLSKLALWTGEQALPEVTLDLFSGYFTKQNVIEVSTADDFYNLVKGRLDETNNSGLGITLDVMAKGGSLKVNKNVVDLIKAYEAKHGDIVNITFKGSTSNENNSGIILNAENSIHMFNYEDNVNVTLNASQEVNNTITGIGTLTNGGDATLTVAKGTLNNVENNGTMVITRTNVLGNWVSGEVTTLTNNGVLTLKAGAQVGTLTNNKTGQLYVTENAANVGTLTNNASVYCRDCTDGYVSISGKLIATTVTNNGKFDVTGTLEVTTLNNQYNHVTSEDGYESAGILNNTGTIEAKTAINNTGTINNGSETVAKGKFVGTLNNEAVVKIYGGEISKLINTEDGKLDVYSETACVTTMDGEGEIYYHDVINQEIGAYDSADKHIYVANQKLTTTHLKKVLSVTNVNVLWLKNDWDHDVKLGDAVRDNLKEVRVGENGGEAEAFILAATGKVNELILPKALIKVGSNDVLKVRNALKLTVNASEGNIHLGAGSILADSNGNITIHDQKDVYVANASDLTSALSSIGTEGVIRLGANMNLTEGLSIDANAGKEFILDLNGKTLDITGGPVGSSGTQTQALHFEKGNVITIKNGTIKASSTDVKMLIQNYADLTLENVTLIHTHDYGYALSNNNGTIVLDGCKINVKEGKVAFDVYNSQYYSDGAKVTVKGNTEINGDIEYGADANYTSDTWVSTLTFEGNNVTVNGELKGDNNTVVKGRWEFALKTQIFGEENVTFNN